MNKFEYNLARFCAPALTGIKTANLMCCIKYNNLELENELKNLQQQLKEFNVEFFVLNQTENRIMLLVFRLENMIQQLKREEIKQFLSKFNYNVNENYVTLLNELKNKINNQQNFPHEIGVFLGYPLDDVKDFIENKKECKLIGTWKVYNNVKQSKKLFKKYNKVTKYVCNNLNKGSNLYEILKKYEVKNC